MPILPDDSLALLDSFAPVFTEPTYQRFLVLMGAAILTTGRRTIANLLRTAGSLAQAIRPATVVSSPPPGGRRFSWPVPRPAFWLLCCLRMFLFSWLVTIRLSLIPDLTSLARQDTAILFGRLTLTPHGGMVINGSCSPCSSASPSRRARGLCPSWSPSTSRKKTTAARGAGTGPRPNI